MDEYKWLIGFVIMVWAVIRWSFIVADKVPAWLDEDWRNQAEEFLKYENASPAPSYKWWTPTCLPGTTHHQLYWIPIIGPWMSGLKTQAFFEFLSIPLSFVLLSLPTEQAFFGIMLCGFLVSLSLIDQRTMLLPDILVYPLLWLGVVKAIFDSAHTSNYLMGLILGFMILFILQQGFKLLRGKDGMGGGDVKLLGALGVWVGVDLVVLVLLVACFVSIIAYLINKIFTKAGGAFPFGPSLAISGFVFYIIKPYVDLAT